VRQMDLLQLPGKALTVDKKRNGHYTPEFRDMAVERMLTSADVTGLAKELRVHRVTLYRWAKGKLHPPVENWPDEDAEKRRLQAELKQTRERLAEKILELDFLKGAMRRVEARRQKNANSGETPSTRKSER